MQEIKEKYILEALEKGYEILSKVSNKEYLYKKISCGHVTKVDANNMRHQKRTTCNECDDIAFENQVKIKGLTLLEKSISSRTPSKYKVNACGHEITIYKGSLFKSNSTYKCEVCYQEKFNKTLEDKGFELIEYVTSIDGDDFTQPSKVGRFKYKGCTHEFNSIRSHISAISSRCYVCNPAKPSNMSAKDQEIDFTSKLNPAHVKEGLEKGLKLLYRTNHRAYGYFERIKCGHKMFLHYGAIRKAKSDDFKCQECFNKKCKDEALEVGLEFIKKIDVQQDTGLYKVKECNHFLEIRIGNVRLCNEKIWGCTKCFEIQCQNEAKEIGAVLHQDISPDSTNRRFYTLACGHTKWLSLGAVRDKSYRCSECQDNRYEQEALNFGVIYNRGVEYSHHNFRNYTLPCGCSREITPSCVKLGAFECKTHSSRNIDFTLPINVYLVKLILPFGEVLKVGFAMDLNGKNSRYSRYGINRENVIPLYEVLFDRGEEAVKFEKYIHSKYKDLKIDKEILREYLENGFTECYGLESLDILLNEFSVYENSSLGDNYGN